MSKPENITEDANGVRRCVIDGEKHVEVECAKGHNWWRKSQRGRRPEFCPEHTEQVEEAAKPEKVEVQWDPSEDDLKIYPKLRGEDRNRITYFDNQLRKPVYRLSSDEKITMSFVVPSTHITPEDRASYVSERKALLENVRNGKHSPMIGVGIFDFRDVKATA